MSRVEPDPSGYIKHMSESDIKKIDVDELQASMRDGNVTVLDVRVHPDEEQIAGALRFDPTKIDDSDIPTLDVPKDRTIVTYCT